jgi:hypothetical protein
MPLLRTFDGGGGVRIPFPFLMLLRRRSNTLKPREAERLYAHIRAQFDADEARYQALLRSAA